MILAYMASGTFLLNVLIYDAETRFSIPHGLLEAVCFTESTHNPQAVRNLDGGQRASVGLCQVQLRTAKEMGYVISQKELMNPSVNLHIAGKYLRFQYDRYHNWLDAVAAYNRGSIKLQSGVYSNQKYVNKVFRRYYQ